MFSCISIKLYLVTLYIFCNAQWISFIVLSFSAKIWWPIQVNIYFCHSFISGVWFLIQNSLTYFWKNLTWFLELFPSKASCTTSQLCYVDGNLQLTIPVSKINQITHWERQQLILPQSIWSKYQEDTCGTD